MQTLYAKRRPKQIKIARETEVIYAKLADRLGIWRIKWEMEDLAFRYLYPEAYFEVERRVHKPRAERRAENDAAAARIRAAQEAEDVAADVYGRPKHLYSIYTKMRRQGIDFDEIYDSKRSASSPTRSGIATNASTSCTACGRTSPNTLPTTSPTPNRTATARSTPR